MSVPYFRYLTVSQLALSSQILHSVLYFVVAGAVVICSIVESWPQKLRSSSSVIAPMLVELKLEL